MKRMICLALFCFYFLQTNAQTSYIQVNGEPGLSVYLNGQFKGKTSAEFNGLVVENVKAGQNLIRIVKDGYVPFEEKIDVKKAEVLAYKVKPFSKHTILISEAGNSEVTDKKASIVSGKLLVQSIPIEIKISIEGVEGAEMVAKTMDKWTADNIPEGNYKLKFTFNNKQVEKNIEIPGNQTTRVFVNMLNGNLTVSRSLEGIYALRAFCDSITDRFHFKAGMNQEQFLQQHPDLQTKRLQTSTRPLSGVPVTSYFTGWDLDAPNFFKKGFWAYSIDAGKKLVNYTWILESEHSSFDDIENIYNGIKAEVASKIDKAYWRELKDPENPLPQDKLIISVPDNSGNISYYITYRFLKHVKGHNVSIDFSTNANIAAQ